MKNILFNCSTNIVGGGAKNAAFFVRSTLKIKKYNFFYALSPQVLKLLSHWNAVPTNYFLFKQSPAKSLKQRRRLLNISINESIDIVYTMAGPSYVKFSCMHIMGLSNPYITHCTLKSILRGRSFFSITKLLLLVLYQMYHSKNACVHIFQTHHSMKNFKKRFFFRRNDSYVVPNAYDKNFTLSSNDNKKSSKLSSIKVFCPGDDYAHKALDSIVYLSNFLTDNFDDLCFTFYLTINKNAPNFYNSIRHLNKKYFQNIIFLGNLNYTEMNQHYKSSDLIYVPSYLETFSATYLEAFSSEKPLIVNNSSFAMDICKKAAVYVNPYDYSSVSSSFVNLFKSPNLQSNIINNGRKLLKMYPSQDERINKILDILSKY